MLGKRPMASCFLYKRREFITLLGGAAAAWPLRAGAQQAGKVYRIGVLEMTSATLNVANVYALRAGLRQLGYFEGQNLVIEYRSADGRDDRFPGLARELLALRSTSSSQEERRRRKPLRMPPRRFR